MGVVATPGGPFCVRSSCGALGDCCWARAPRRFSPVEVKPLMERPRPLPKTVCSLLADHQKCKRTWPRCALGPATPARRWWRRRPTLLAHRQDVVSLAVERDRSGAIHRLKILLALETRRTLLLDDGQRA